MELLSRLPTGYVDESSVQSSGGVCLVVKAAVEVCFSRSVRLRLKRCIRVSDVGVLKSMMARVCRLHHHSGPPPPTSPCPAHIGLHQVWRNMYVCIYVCELFLHIGRIRMDIDNSGVTWELNTTCKGIQRMVHTTVRPLPYEPSTCNTGYMRRRACDAGGKYYRGSGSPASL
jgi:hypothetical protein